jgi:hypothetical protein
VTFRSISLTVAAVAVAGFNAFAKTINIGARNTLKEIFVILVCALPSHCPRIILTHLSDW